ncbi:MAG: hypothetical protein ABSF94_02940 [Steroidobacteraceae bacterium]|jgi:hypothetical protein
MIGPEDDRRALTEARLARSRQELFDLLETQATGIDPSGAAVFPRSRTMRMLLSPPGLGAAAAICGGLLFSRPALAARLLRMVPAGAVARTLFKRLFKADASTDVR